MRSFLAAIVLCASTAAASVAWQPYSDPAVQYAGLSDHYEISASRHPPANRPVLIETHWGDSITPPYRVHPRPKPLSEILLSESAKAVGKGPRELGTRLDLWCADFFNKTLARLGLKGTGSALASSFVHWGKPSKPCVGCIAVKTRRGGNHVVVIKSIKGNTVIAISPNSRGKVREMRYSVRQFYAFRVPA